MQHMVTSMKANKRAEGPTVHFFFFNRREQSATEAFTCTIHVNSGRFSIWNLLANLTSLRLTILLPEHQFIVAKALFPISLR